MSKKNGWLVLALFCLPGLAQAGWAEYNSALAMLKDGTISNDAQGAAAMLRLAEAGEMDAQAYMAYLYSQGIGVARDPVASARWEALAMAHPQATDSMRTSFKSLREKGGQSGLAEMFLTMDAQSRESRRLREDGERMINDSGKTLDELIPRQQAVDAELEEATRELERLRSQRQSESQLLQDPVARSTPAAPASVPPDGASALKAIYKNAIGGDTRAMLDLATLYYQGEAKGIVTSRNDLHCYLWSLQVNSKQDSSAAAMTDACGKKLPLEVRHNVVMIVESLEKRLRPAPLPATRDQAVADFLAGLEFEDKQQLRGFKREELSGLNDSWGLFVGHRYGLWYANDELVRSVCGKSCAPEAAAAGILEAAWDTLQ